MYWPLLHMYSENFGFGPGVFFIRGTFLNQGKGLYVYVSVHINTHKCIYTYMHTYVHADRCPDR